MNEKTGIGFGPSGKQMQSDPQHDISSLDPKLSRTNYFDGRLLKASDLTRDQAYLDERLREVGRVIGSGIVRGLETHLDPNTHYLHVDPGLAVAPSGRVLELTGKSLAINLHDTANIDSLNPDTTGRISRGLYAVTIQFAEVGTDSAEVYPRDLEGQRGFHFNAWSEGIEVSLAPLRQGLPSAAASKAERGSGGLALAARSALVREFISNPGQPIDLPEDAIALALIAIEHGRPLWLDRGLVRRPHRHPHTAHALQQDLHRHYQELLNDIIQSRLQRHLSGEFPASHYFRVLPPFGNLPKSTVTPEAGRQSWFPPGYDVNIAPVRKDDLAAILAESSALDPIDLEKDGDVDIMILVPMSDHQFAWRARQLQHREDQVTTETHTALPHLDQLALRLYDMADTGIDPDDASIWRAIWSEASQPLFVRRPPRVAETLVSGVVLASGYEIPEASKGLPPDPEKIEKQRDDFEDKLRAAERRIERLKLRIEELRARLELDADDRLKEAEKELAKLKDALEDALVDKDKLELLQKQAEMQKAEIAMLREKIAVLEAASGEGDTELLELIESLKKDLADAKTQNTALKKKLEEAGSNTGLPTVLQLVALRNGDADALKAGTKLAEIIAEDGEPLLAVHQIAQLIDARYDKLLFATLVEVAKAKALTRLRDFLAEVLPKESIGAVMAEALREMGLADSLSKAWLKHEKALGTSPIPTDTGTAELEKEIERLTALNKTAEARIVELEKALDGRSPASDGGSLERISEPEFSIDFRTVKVRPLEELWEERLPGFKTHPEIDEIQAAAEKVFTQTKDDRTRRARACQILAITPAKYDPATWRTLPVVLLQDNGAPFRDYLVKVREAKVNIGLAVAADTELGLKDPIKALWVAIDLPK